MISFEFVKFRYARYKRIFEDFNLDFSDFKHQFPVYDQFFHSRISNLSRGQRRLVELYLIVKSKSNFAMLDELSVI